MQFRRSSWKTWLWLVVLVWGVRPSSQAQTNTSALTGVVTDPTGAVVAGVSVTLKNTASGQVLKELTKSKGEYSFEQVEPGPYEIRVNAPGFSEEVETVDILVATPLKENFKLVVGNAEIVTVEATIAAVNSTDATLGKPFDSGQVQSLPYLANDITYLLSLQPGVLAIDSGSTSGGLNTDTRTGIVNGARQDQTNITLDGVDNNDQTNGYAFNGALRATRESVEEFRVTTQNANADAGRSSGGQVSLVTRSGTNIIHGSAYYYNRNDWGLQNAWFLKQTLAATGAPNRPIKVLEDTYGASLGLPIKKDKLFFFGAYEGYKQASDVIVQATVPSTPGGGGLVTSNVTYGACAAGVASCSAVSTYKTLTPADIALMDPKCTANGTCPPPNGPGTDKAAIAYFNSFPLANGTVTGDGYNTGSYTFASPQPLHQITNIARLDYSINSKQQVFVRGNLQSDNQAGTLPFPGQPPGTNVFGNTKGIAGGHIWSITNNLTNNFRYGLVRQGTATRGTGSQPYVGFSTLSTITGVSTSSIYIVTTNNFADDFTYVKGRHIIQFGVNDRILSNSRYFDSPLLSSATISATLLATAAIAGKGTSLDPGAFGCPDCAAVATPFRTFYNAAILDNTGIIEQSQSGTEYTVQNNLLVPQATAPTHIYRNLEQEYYVQDQWKVTPHFTLTAGLRYVYLGTPYEKNGQEIAPTVSLNTFLQNRIAAMNAGTDYTTRISFAAAGSANNAPNFWNPQKGNFAPRVAFAYATSDNKTSIRGGFALAYDHVGEGIIDYYESTSSSLLSLSKTNQFTYTNVDTNPRFTGYHNVPLGAVTTSALALPYTPADNPFTFLRSINNIIKTPYAETFNVSLQHEFKKNQTVTVSYVGRLGRHLLANLDVAQPLNLFDPGSGQTYFQAAKAFDQLYDSGTPVANVPDSGYFHNLFPNASYKGYKGAQAYYAYLAAGDRGNETDPLYNFDTTTTASPGGASSFRFFFPQTSSIFAQSTVAGSNYNALQLSLRGAFKYGVVYDFNYTFAKSLDQGSSPERSAANLLTNTFGPSQQYAPSDFDVRHNITGDFNAPLPFGHGRPFFSKTNGFVDRVIGGWQLNGVVHYSTAFPFSAVASGNYGTNFDTSSFFVKTGPIATGGHNYSAGGAKCGSATAANCQSALKNLTPAQAFANLRYPYAGEVGQRNVFRADGYFSLDNGLQKSFRTYREESFTLKAEVFNVTGSPRFNALTTNGASTKFGLYTSTLNAPRQMQVSGTYRF